MAGGVSAVQIFEALRHAGLNTAQAIGVMANMVNESSLNVETNAMDSNGARAYGLISWNAASYPDAPGLVTGNPARDLAAQVQYLLHRTSGIGPGLSGGDATTVAGNFAQYVEVCQGCGPGGSQWAARRANVSRVQSLLGSAAGSDPGGAPYQPGGGGGGGGGAPVQATLTGFFPGPLTDLLAGPFGIIEGIAKLLTSPVTSPVEGLWHALSAIAVDLTEIVNHLEWLFQPSHWVRIGAFILGTAIAIPGVSQLSKAGSGDMSLATGILMVTVAAILFFIAFHNLPDDVKDLSGLLGWISEGIRTKSAPEPLSTRTPPTSSSTRTPPPGSHPAVTTPKPVQVPSPQPAPGG